jgi:hypothetical protein
MNDSPNKILLSVLLTLNNLETELSTEELNTLEKAGRQLDMRPQKWESILSKLIETLSTNPEFKKKYQDIQNKIQNQDSPLPAELTPSIAELNSVLPPDNKVVKRAFFEGQPEQESNEILNVAISILKAPEPVKTTQKVSSFQKLKNYLKSLGKQ